MFAAISDNNDLPDRMDLEDDDHFADTARNLCGLLINIVNGHVYFIHLSMRMYAAISDHAHMEQD